MKKGLIFGIIALVVVAIGVLVVIRVIQKGEQEEQITEEIPSVLAVKAMRVDVERTLVFYGTLEPKNMVFVFPDAPGKVVRFYVTEGSGVAKGTLVAEVDRDVAGMDFQLLPVKSPTWGVVASIMVDPGMSVAPQTSIASIYTVNDLILPLSVGEKDFPLVSKGQEVKAEFDSFPDEVFTGNVTKIYPTLNPLSHTVRVDVRLDDPDRKLRSGMFGRLEVNVGSFYDLLVVPKEALIVEGEETFVKVVQDGIYKEVPVAVGESFDAKVEIVSGLMEGQLVVIRSAEGLEPGTEVMVQEREWDK